LNLAGFRLMLIDRVEFFLTIGHSGLLGWQPARMGATDLGVIDCWQKARMSTESTRVYEHIVVRDGVPQIAGTRYKVTHLVQERLA